MDILPLGWVPYFHNLTVHSIVSDHGAKKSDYSTGKGWFFNIVYLKGGIDTWINAGFNTHKIEQIFDNTTLENRPSNNSAWREKSI